MALDNPLLRALRGTAPRLSRLPALEDDPEAEPKPGVLRRIGSTAVSGLSATGNVLDIPGSMVRDIAALENPFDQLLTPTSDVNRTSGRDLLRKYGMAGPKDTWGNWGAGLGTEILLDPTTYLTFGSSAALGAGGKAAKAAGMLDDVTRVAAKKLGTSVGKVGRREALTTTSVDDLIRELTPEFVQGGRHDVLTGLQSSLTPAQRSEPLSRMFSVTYPFTRKPIPYIDEAVRGAASAVGLTPQRMARGLDYLGDKITYARVPGTNLQPVNALRRIFSSSLKDAATPEGQAAAQALTRQHEASESAVRTKTAGYAHQRTEAGLGADFADTLRESLENNRGSDPGAWRDIVSGIHGDLKQDLLDAREWGHNLKQLKDEEALYFPRFASDRVEFKPGSDAAAFSTKHGSKIRRLGSLRNIRGGTVKLKEIIKDADIAALIEQGASRKKIGEKIAEKFGDVVPEKFMNQKTGAWVNQRRSLAGFIQKLPKELREIGLFGNDPLVDYEAARVATRQAIDTTKQIVQTIAQPGIIKPAGDTAAGPTIAAVLKKIGINPGDSSSGAIKKINDLLGMALDPRDPEKYIKEFAQQRIDARLADDLVRIKKAYDTPEPVSQLVQAFDSVQNWSKTMWTSPWPAFASRNFVSSQFDNWVAGMWSLRSIKDAFKMLRGGVIEGAAEIPAVKSLADERGILKPKLLNDFDDPFGSRAFSDEGLEIFEVPVPGPGGLVNHHVVDWGGVRVRATATPGGAAASESMIGDFATRQEALEAAEEVLSRRLPPSHKASSGLVPGLTDREITEYGMASPTLDKFGQEVLGPFLGGGDVPYLSSMEPLFRQFPEARAEAASEIVRIAKELPRIVPPASQRSLGLNAVRQAYVDGEIRGLKDTLEELAEAGEFEDGLAAIRQRMQPRALDDATATKLLSEMAYGDKIVGKHETLATDVAGQTRQLGGNLDQILGAIPGERPFSFKETAKRYAGMAPGTTWNPLDVRGVGGRVESQFAPAAGGQDLNYAVEFMARMSPYIHQLRRGVERRMAAGKVGAAQVQYANKYYTKTEQQVFRRLFPFYSFTSRKLPWTLEVLLQNPGGKLGQTLRTLRSLRGGEATTPDYVAETTSIPLPGGKEGNQRYLTGLGLSFEDPLSLLMPDVSSTGLELLSRTTPAVKAPLEYAVGESFFQRGPSGGRELEDMDPLLGRLLANVTGSSEPVNMPLGQELDVLLANSPAARALTTARQLTDRRKGIGAKALNLLTGVRVSDISPAAQDAKLRELVQQREKDLGAKKFLKVYFPDDVLQQMSPRDRQSAEELIDLNELLEGRAKRRKKARQNAS